MATKPQINEIINKDTLIDRLERKVQYLEQELWKKAKEKTDQVVIGTPAELAIR